MSKYELWAKPFNEPNYIKIIEFDNYHETQSRIDNLLETGEYSEATVIKDFKYVLGKEYQQEKTKRR